MSENDTEDRRAVSSAADIARVVPSLSRRVVPEYRLAHAPRYHDELGRAYDRHRIVADVQQRDRVSFAAGAGRPPGHDLPVHRAAAIAYFEFWRMRAHVLEMNFFGPILIGRGVRVESVAGTDPPPGLPGAQPSHHLCRRPWAAGKTATITAGFSRSR